MNISNFTTNTTLKYTKEESIEWLKKVIKQAKQELKECILAVNEIKETNLFIDMSESYLKHLENSEV